MSVGRICQREVDLAEAGESVHDAAERMRQRTVGCLVVVNEHQEPIGILTDRDIAIRVVAEGRDAWSTRVAKVMTAAPKTVSERTAIESALGLMRSGAFRRLPVVDEEGRLVGIVTLDDILILLAEEFTQVGQLLERETPFAASVMA
jgi:CBS domain-containing protein